jgi:hypothetical protein
MPRSASVSSVHDRQSITFECTEFRSTPAAIPEEGTVRYFQHSSVGAPAALYYYHFQQPPFISGSYLFTIQSFISATKSITQCGNWCWGYGLTQRLFLEIITQSGKLQQHHRSTTTKLQVGVLRNKLRCIFVGFQFRLALNSSHFSR